MHPVRPNPYMLPNSTRPLKSRHTANITATRMGPAMSSYCAISFSLNPRWVRIAMNFCFIFVMSMSRSNIHNKKWKSYLPSNKGKSSAKGLLGSLFGTAPLSSRLTFVIGWGGGTPNGLFTFITLGWVGYCGLAGGICCLMGAGAGCFMTGAGLFTIGAVFFGYAGCPYYVSKLIWSSRYELSSSSNWLDRF